MPYIHHQSSSAWSLRSAMLSKRIVGRYYQRNPPLHIFRVSSLDLMTTEATAGRHQPCKPMGPMMNSRNRNGVGKISSATPVICAFLGSHSTVQKIDWNALKLLERTIAPPSMLLYVSSSSEVHVTHAQNLKHVLVRRRVRGFDFRSYSMMFLAPWDRAYCSLLSISFLVFSRHNDSQLHVWLVPLAGNDYIFSSSTQWCKIKSAIRN